MLLEGKRIVVSGGARGIGAGVVRAFVREGAHVAVLDVKDELGHDVADDATRSGPGAASYHHCDIMKRDDVFGVVDTAVAAMGGLDVLVNSAAIQIKWELAEDLTDELWDLTFAVNVKGTVYLNQAACVHMKKLGYGKIINFSSMAGVTGSAGNAPYASSKGAVLAWTRSIAKEWGRYGIRVNAVNPFIATPIRAEGIQNSHFEPEGTIPKRWAPTDERDEGILLVHGKHGLKGDADADLGPVMVFLASDGSDFITGQMLQVDGGALMAR